MRKATDKIRVFYDYGIEPDSRTIFMGTNYESENTGVDYLMAERVIKGLTLLDATTGTIRIIMNNEGGFWYDGIAMFDAIKACKNHVTIDVYGQAFSMGAILLQAADTRRMAKHAKIMMHYGLDGISSVHPEIYRRWAEESKRVKSEMENIFLERMRVKNPKLSVSALRSILNFDTIYSTEEAINMGLADKEI